MIALRKWANDFLEKNKRDPTSGEVWGFIQILQERAWIDTSTDLASLEEEEREIREMADDMCAAMNFPSSRVKIFLTPNPSWTFRVQGGTPSEIYLGIRIKTRGFRSILANALSQANKLYRSSSLVPMSKVREYRHDTKRLRVLHEDSDHYKLIDPSRIKIVEHRTFTCIDQKTGELVTVSQEVNVGQFRHYVNDRLAHEGRLYLSRKLMAMGKLVNEEEELDEDEGDEE